MKRRMTPVHPLQKVEIAALMLTGDSVGRRDVQNRRPLGAKRCALQRGRQETV